MTAPSQSCRCAHLPSPAGRCRKEIGLEGADVGRTESNASRTFSACGAAVLVHDRQAWRRRIFPPKALPRMINCTSGKIIDTSISAGERKNLRISRSTMAIIRFIKPAFLWICRRL